MSFAGVQEVHYEASGGMGLVGMIIYAVIGLVYVAGIWKVFSKAGEPGWAAIIPIYNLITMVKIAGKPMWWVVLFFIPIANLIAAIIVFIGIAQRFGKGAGFGLGMVFFGFIFWPLLGFGGATAAPALAPAR
jgi:hypothetical protein